MKRFLRKINPLNFCTLGKSKIIPWHNPLRFFSTVVFFFVFSFSNAQTIFLSHLSPSSPISSGFALENVNRGSNELSKITLSNRTVTIVDGNGNDLPCASICAGSSITLYADFTGNPNIISWTSSPAGFASTDQNITVSPTSTITYTITVTDGNGVTASDDVTVTVNALPTVTADDKQVCFGNNSVALTGTPLGGTWSGLGVSGSTFNANGLVAGNYTVTYTYIDGNGCTNSATANVTVNIFPTVSITSQTNVLCFGNSTGSV